MLSADFIWEVAVGILTIFLADKFISGVNFSGSLLGLVICGLVLGVIYAFVRPLIKKITLPLRVLTLGIFGFIIDMSILWFIDIAFTELQIIGILPLIYSTLIAWGLHLILGLKK